MAHHRSISTKNEDTESSTNQTLFYIVEITLLSIAPERLVLKCWWEMLLRANVLQFWEWEDNKTWTFYSQQGEESPLKTDTKLYFISPLLRTWAQLIAPHPPLPHTQAQLLPHTHYKPNSKKPQSIWEAPFDPQEELNWEDRRAFLSVFLTTWESSQHFGMQWWTQADTSYAS